MEILDSGARREFETGAVRDIAEDKGRCDLMPLYVVGEFIESPMLECIEIYMRTGQTGKLYDAIELFIVNHYPDKYTALMEVSKQYQEGAKKYSDRNWEKGMPVHCFIDSAVRHYLKVLRGDQDEPHTRAVIWNLLGAIWMHENHPELIDLPFKNDNGKSLLVDYNGSEPTKAVSHE
jgi:hypothetical protein